MLVLEPFLEWLPDESLLRLFLSVLGVTESESASPNLKKSLVFDLVVRGGTFNL